jgi:hypothetical protein
VEEHMGDMEVVAAAEVVMQGRQAVVVEDPRGPLLRHHAHREMLDSRRQ